MAAHVEEYNTKIRVFKWDVQLLNNAHLQFKSLYSGLFLIRVTTEVLPRRGVPELQVGKAELLPCFKVHLENLRREVLPCDVLEQLPILRVQQS